MSETFKEIIRFLFEDVGLNRIEAYHDFAIHTQEM